MHQLFVRLEEPRDEYGGSKEEEKGEGGGL
jgi:hypothetical protein